MLAGFADAALAEVIDRDADVVQRDAGVQQSLDDLEDKDVLERIQPLAARDRQRCCESTGADQRRPRPMTSNCRWWMPPGDLAGARPAVADELVRHRVDPGTIRPARVPLRTLVIIQAALSFIRKVQLLLTWRVFHSRILSPIELVYVTCTAARLPKHECVEHTLPAGPDCPSRSSKYGCPVAGSRETRAACRAREGVGQCHP